MMINVETSSSKYKLNLNNLIMNSKISLKKTSSFGSNYHAAEWLMGILGKNRLIKTTLEEPCQFTTLKIHNLTLMERGSWMKLEGGGELNQPTPSRSPRITVKRQFFFDFLRVYNELGKVKKS